jgi:hypothetical protein
MNQKDVVRDAFSSSLAADAGLTVDLEYGSKHSLIEVELTNVRENPHEPGSFRVDVYRFLNGTVRCFLTLFPLFPISVTGSCALARTSKMVTSFR